MMAFVSDARADAIHALLTANERYVQQSSNDNAAAISTVGNPFCHAINQFHNGRYSECINQLQPIRRHLDQLGGSYVQREVLEWTLLEAAIRSHQYPLAVALANERCELKAGSAQRWLDLARGLEGLNDVQGMATAREAARKIIAAAGRT